VVACVAGEVRRALVNQDDNARRAAPSGTVRICLHEVLDEVLLEVHDDGTAVPAETAGSSLGLAVVRDVAARHGGAVSERTSPLGGMAVTLRLPRGGE
jgi:two-component system sensor histidine kinase TctE